MDGSGRTVELACGKRKGVTGLCIATGNGGGGGGVGGGNKERVEGWELFGWLRLDTILLLRDLVSRNLNFLILLSKSTLRLCFILGVISCPIKYLVD